MKEIWMRMGVHVSVSEEELFRLMERAHKEYQDSYGVYGVHEDGMDDCDLTEEECAKYLKRAVAAGDGYIPEDCFDQHLEWYLHRKEELTKTNRIERNKA